MLLSTQDAPTDLCGLVRQVQRTTNPLVSLDVSETDLSCWRGFVTEINQSMSVQEDWGVIGMKAMSSRQIKRTIVADVCRFLRLTDWSDVSENRNGKLFLGQTRRHLSLFVQTVCSMRGSFEKTDISEPGTMKPSKRRRTVNVCVFDVE